MSSTKTGATHRATAGTHKAPMLNPAAYKARAPETFRAKFTTTKGAFVVEVHRDWAPNGADRFYNLVKGGFYDGAPIFRVLPGFMAQFGIPSNPAVAKAWEKADIKDDPVKQSNKRGYITFANTGEPNSRGTQVFINYKDNAFLDGQRFAPFGEVVEGMDVVDKFYSGYGEGAPQGSGPDQQKLTNEGITYVNKSFPNLDKIVSAVVEPGPAPATPSGTAKPPGTAKPAGTANKTGAASK